jgi:hypothetical protein
MTVWIVKTSPVNQNETASPAVAQQEDFNAIKNLDVLENYDVVSSMDALSQLAPNPSNGGVQDEQSKAPAVE